RPRARRATPSPGLAPVPPPGPARRPRGRSAHAGPRPGRPRPTAPRARTARPSAAGRPARGPARGTREHWSQVDTAFGLGRAGPAAGARVLAGLDASRARLAADRRVAVVEQRVEQAAVLVGVVVDPLERPSHQWVDLDHRVLGVPLRGPGAGAGVGGHATQPGDPGPVAGERGVERLDLA